MPSHDPGTSRTEIEVRFPLGAYHAQSTTAFGEPEWPPHPVRLVAALVAAAAFLPDDEREPAQAAIASLSGCPETPVIVAPRLAGHDGTSEAADGRQVVAAFRGASQWAPRNHELSELSAKGLHPRELGRGRAEVNKGGVAVGEQPVVFSWPLALDDSSCAALARAADEVTVLGTSRSPVLVTVRSAQQPPDSRAVWAPGASMGTGVDVRVPTADLPAVLDAWHARRSAPIKRGAPVKANLVPPASLGKAVAYRHGANPLTEPPLDPRWWGDMLVVAVDRDSEQQPKGPAAFAFARAFRSALLSRYADAGGPDDAPPVLRSRASQPHAAFVPLPFVGHERADGRLLGIAIVLPHVERLPDVPFERLAVERGLLSLISQEGLSIGVPGVGDVRVRPVPPSAQAGATLQPERWRRTSRTWSSVTPVVHSRYRRNDRPASLLEQVTADCHDAGLPSPRAVELRPRSRFKGAPSAIARRHLPEAWKGPLRGPTDHLDIEFDQPVAGPVLLGRARHFGLGLLLATSGSGSA